MPRKNGDSASKAAGTARTRPSSGRGGATGSDGSRRKATKGSGRSRLTQGPVPQRLGEYLIRRLYDYGVRDVFGIPGDFVLQFYSLLEESPLRVIGTTREDNAGYAADAYARVHGLGAVCVTYCVGGLSLCNSIAGAYAEKSPVVVISGAPGVEERRSDPLLHHRVRDFDTQREVFEKITAAAVSLNDPLTAFRDIDRCLEAAVRYKRPVFLELPRDRVFAESPIPHQPIAQRPKSDRNALKEALAEASERISRARQPVIIAGVEIHRFRLQEALLAFAERHGIPICATLLGKSVISEKHPLYLGVYEGAMGREDVREFVEQSDCVILLGTFMTDINLGIYTARLDPARCIYATSERLRIGYHHFHDVLLEDFVNGLKKAPIRFGKPPAPPSIAPPEPQPFVPKPDTPITIRRLYQKINALLDEKTVVIADVGDSLFAAVDLTIYRQTEFLSPAYYTSMGFAVPASVGVQVANRDLRPIVLVGDGAFQMTGTELTTSLKLGFDPIVIVLNNHGYTTERFLQEGPFNDIPNWAFHRLPDLLGGGWGFEVRTETDLEQALEAALAKRDAFTLLNVHLDPHDISPALARLAKRLAKKV
ncbi:MAG: alpha-keto acid decarboxylase family protein [Planctomycetota bacterium]|nr:MAG: alpha-keto acid decarboxylase family protein [Planctomycetota bacterium]